MMNTRIVHVRVTLKMPTVQTQRSSAKENESVTTNWTIKAPTREFKGNIRWNISEKGHLTINRLEGVQPDTRIKAFITFAHGQWTSVEEVSDEH